MFERGTEPDTAATSAVGLLATAIDALTALDLTTLDRDELLGLARAVETQRRRLPVIDHRLVAELDARGVAFELGCASTAALIRAALRLAPADAKARVSAAADLGPRRAVSGEALPPLFAGVSAAQAEGAISTHHAKVIVDAIDELPAQVQAEHAAAIEERLVADARTFDPTQLCRLARRIVAIIDPDGTLADDRHHERRRGATLSHNGDGSGELRAHLTPAALAVWQAVLDPLAAPRPNDETGRDTRTPAQRLHDALLDAGQRLLRSGELPVCGGIPATVIVTMTLSELESRTGFATTSHGGQLSVADALAVAAEADVIPVVLNDSGGVLSHGRVRRTASAAQRLALIARDGGCSFPGCDRPPEWTQAHHIVHWVHGGATDLENLTLLCGFHHREFERCGGWAVAVIDGIPNWIPPPWIDPDRTPVRNTMHLAAVS
jgi:hypothetical protein